MKYLYLLFDADDTLFDFSKSADAAFSALCRGQDIPDTPEVRQKYYDINHALWAAFDRGEITKEYLTVERYVRFLKTLDLKRDPEACNREYLEALGQSVFPLPGAKDICRTLAERGHRMYITTNAVASVQKTRLQKCGFGEVFAGVFISEEAGAAKPSLQYFDYIRSRIPEITAENTLVIGDSLTTDIRGANNAGLPCCWFNPKGLPRAEELQIDYEIKNLQDLLEIV